ncbi:hypothetical protein BD779DRAFT_1443695, partial [Infundibulicybe gibba]
ALDKWWADCDELHWQMTNEGSLLREILTGELYYAKLWLCYVVSHGCCVDMPIHLPTLSEYRYVPLPSRAMLNGPSAALRYAVHDSLVTAAFPGPLSPKMADPFSSEPDPRVIIAQVEQPAQPPLDLAAERSAANIIAGGIPALSLK